MKEFSVLMALADFIPVVLFCAAVIILIRKALGYIDVEGYTTIVILILLAFGIIMFSLGILGEYIWRMFDETRNRPPFIIDKVEKKDQEQ